MKNEEFMEVLNDTEAKIKENTFDTNEIKNLMNEASKVSGTEEEKAMIREKLDNIRRKSLTTTKWNLLVEDINSLVKSRSKNKENYQKIADFVNQIEEYRTNPSTSEDISNMKNTYTEISAIAEEFLDNHLLKNFKNEVEKKFRFLENRGSKKTSRKKQKNIFGNWLRNYTKEQNISIQSLAKTSGISASYLYRLEATGDITPSKSKLEKLAKALNINVEDIPVQNTGKRRGRPVKMQNKTQSNSRKKSQNRTSIDNSEIIKSNTREKNQDLFNLIRNENIQVNNRTLNEDEREALKGCLMFMFDSNKDISEITRFFNQMSILR